MKIVNKIPFLLTCLTLSLEICSCGPISKQDEPVSSVEKHSEAADNTIDRTYFDVLTPNELARGVYRLSLTHYFDEALIKKNDNVICSTITQNDDLGVDILETHPQFEGMEYIIAFDDDNSIGQLYIYCPMIEDYGIGCYGEITDIAELGVSDWNGLSEIYKKGIPDNQNKAITKDFSINDFTNNYDKAVIPQVTLTGNSKAIDRFNINRLSRTMTENIPIEGRLGDVFELRANGNVKNAVLTFTYDTELLFISDIDTFLPTIYYYNDETYAFTEIMAQTRTQNSVSAEIDKLGTYVLMDKTEYEAVYGN